MRRICRDRPRNGWSFWQPRRTFQVIQRGHDKPQESLYDKIGFSKDNESIRVRRSITDLQQGLLREVEKLEEPETNASDKTRLADLKKAYTLLHDDNFRANYGSHYYASNDAKLHVLCDGGQVAANHNPEHQQFTYIDHAIDRDSPGVSSALSSSAEGSTGSNRNSNAAAASMREAPTADVLRDAFRNATGVGAGSSGATSATAQVHTAAEAASPANGADISHLLRITLEQSLAGGEIELELQKHVRCGVCRGSGRQRLARARRCPQCLGRGSTHLPSATYHIERRCLFCGGEGTMPAPPCRTCHGRAVLLHQPVQVPITIPPGTLSNTLFRLRHGGHDGIRGGHAGDLLLTVLIGEHRYFFRHPEKAGELHAMLPLPLSVALLGGRVEVPTQNGRAMLHVPPCVRNGHILPFDVYGLRPDGTGISAGGDAVPASTTTRLLFHALVMVPRVDALSGRQRAALRRYEAQETPSETVAADTCETTEKGTFHLNEGAGGEEAGTAASLEDLLAECAALKTTYKHWFTSS